MIDAVAQIVLHQSYPDIADLGRGFCPIGETGMG
jgi:hypothetical protein